MPSMPPPSPDRPDPVPARPELPEGVWRPDPPRRDALPRWPLWSPFAGMLGGLVVAVVGVGVIALAVELAGGDTTTDTPPGVTIGGTYVQDVALIGAALVLAHVLDAPVTPGKFGLRLPPLRRAVGRMLLAWGCFFVFSLAWAAA